MTLPSKELLSEVLDIKVVEVYKIRSNPNFKDNTLLHRIEGCAVLFTINIHELAHKCKEWAYKNKFIIETGFTTSGDWFYTVLEVKDTSPYVAEVKTNWGITEPEAVFQACQWVLDNKDEK